MKDENTTFDNVSKSNEDTLLNSQEGAEKQDKVNDGNKTNRAKWVKIAGGAGTGLLLGSAAMLLMGSKLADGEMEPSDDNTAEQEDASVGSNTIGDGNIPLATSATADMTFEEAFDAARQEHGPGATFVWHGNVYSTYLAEEWKELTAQQQDDYVGHATDTSSAQHAENNDTVEVISVDDSYVNKPTDDGENNNGQNEQGSGNENNNNQQQHLQAALNENMEVEVLGVIHDDESGVNVVNMTVDGHDAILVDVDNDNNIDGIIVDMNDDGNISDNEIADISDQGLTIDQFTDQTNAPQNFCIDDNSLPDYTNDLNNIDGNA